MSLEERNEVASVQQLFTSLINFEFLFNFPLTPSIQHLQMFLWTGELQLIYLFI